MSELPSRTLCESRESFDTDINELLARMASRQSVDVEDLLAMQRKDAPLFTFQLRPRAVHAITAEHRIGPLRPSIIGNGIILNSLFNVIMDDGHKVVAEHFDGRESGLVPVLPIQSRNNLPRLGVGVTDCTMRILPFEQAALGLEVANSAGRSANRIINDAALAYHEVMKLERDPEAAVWMQDATSECLERVPGFRD